MPALFALRHLSSQGPCSRFKLGPGTISRLTIISKLINCLKGKRQACQMDRVEKLWSLHWLQSTTVRVKWLACFPASILVGFGMAQ